jgi:hypothetical protein
MDHIKYYQEMEQIKFEIGQWIECEDGYGQIIHIRDFFVEPFKTDTKKEEKVGDFLRQIYVCKILCGFKGEIKKQSRISIYTSIAPLADKAFEIVNDIKLKQIGEYYNYIHYEDKYDICKQVFLAYRIGDDNSFDIKDIKTRISEINRNLYPSFTFKEFSIEFKKYNFPFKLEEFIRYDDHSYINEKIELRFDSRMYKVKGKETIFQNVVLLG